MERYIDNPVWTKGLGGGICKEFFSVCYHVFVLNQTTGHSFEVLRCNLQADRHSKNLKSEKLQASSHGLNKC
jgi:hypothetical protein